MAKKQSELNALNSKLDILIGLMTQQVQHKPSIECQDVVLVVPEKKKRGRPRKVQPQVPVVVSPAVEHMVSLMVSPEININGDKYLGNVTVKESIALQLRRMMQQWEKYERRTQQFIDHGVRDHGVM